MKNNQFNYLLIVLFIALSVIIFNPLLLKYFSSIIWSITTILMLSCGLYFSYKLHFIQLNIKEIIISLFSKSSSLKSLAISLSSRIGVGSLSGIALSIYLGGVGTIFWLWITSIIMAVNCYVESYYGVIYQEKEQKISKGGPSYYISKGLNNKKLALLYSVLIIITYSFAFTTIQANTIVKSIKVTFNINYNIIILLLVLITIFFIMKDIKKITQYIARFVPFMLIPYLILGVIIIVSNINDIKNILFMIFTSAFNIKSLGFGLLGVVIMGLQRGVFATEAGIGTSAMAAGSTNNDPKKEAMLQVLGIYFTSLIICTITAFIILTSNYSTESFNNINGIELILYAFNYHFGKFGNILLCLITCLFAYSTIISSYYYGEVNLLSIKKNINNKIINIFKIIFIIFIIIGSISNSIFLWRIVDILIAFLAIINLYSLIKLFNHNKIFSYNNKR